MCTGAKRKKKMNIKTLTAAVLAAGCVFGATADEQKAPPTTADTKSATPVAIEETDDPFDTLISAEFGLNFHSRYMTYGMIDGKDPIIVPGAKVTFFDWVYFGVESIFDMTKGNGKRGGYGNRAGRWTTLDSMVGIAHEFELGEKFGKLSVDFNYMYEYIERYHSNMGDTQYVNLELGLSDGIFWLEPTLWIERDLMADEGTYVNLDLGHSFAIIDGKGEDDDPVLEFRPSVGQGFGNTQRVRGYSPDVRTYDHGGVMDTCIKGEFTWKVQEHVSFAAYVAYSDYWFDSTMRECAREHNAAWGKGCDHSWNFYGGVSVIVEF